MTIWLDAQISPKLAGWITETMGVDCRSIREVGLRDAKDQEIFREARSAGAVIMTKDSDFVGLQARLGFPPKILWLTCGKTSNARLQAVLATTLHVAIGLSQQGEDLVEIDDQPAKFDP